MTYEDVVEKMQTTYENADARRIFEHIAIQINIEGEASGAFYLEVANRSICVEPYDYHDRDGLIITRASVLFDLCDQKYTLNEALERKFIRYQGNMEKFQMLDRIILKSASSEAETEEPAAAEAKPEDKPAAKTSDMSAAKTPTAPLFAGISK